MAVCLFLQALLLVTALIIFVLYDRLLGGLALIAVVLIFTLFSALAGIFASFGGGGAPGM